MRTFFEYIAFCAKNAGKNEENNLPQGFEGDDNFAGGRFEKLKTIAADLGGQPKGPYPAGEDDPDTSVFTFADGAGYSQYSFGDGSDSARAFLHKVRKLPWVVAASRNGEVVKVVVR